ncbi:transmembrane protein 65 isoform X3 [Tamandua tetradactyla]|uniref:transmembrane protein 65 isoform X3 n=1 Tax=Tamandua tetradactyla TaxID=48850 RepID=UPI0040539BBD
MLASSSSINSLQLLAPEVKACYPCQGLGLKLSLGRDRTGLAFSSEHPEPHRVCPVQAAGSADLAKACRYPKPEIAIVKHAKEISSAETPDSLEKLEAPPPTPGQLRYVFIHNAIPFVGFGFLDNAIMIVAGTHIEMSIGIILGISTMAAAALGNLVSDLAGLGLAGYVEALASRLGLSIPDLTPKQVDMWQTRVSAHLGKAVGVAIGCILGMFPLLFFGGGEEDEKLEKEN